VIGLGEDEIGAFIVKIFGFEIGGGRVPRGIRYSVGNRFGLVFHQQNIT
jgi:hypothetical protein